MVLSPGIPHTYPKPHQAVENARRYYVPIVGDIDLLAQSNDAFTVGVTGTNGKSTTTALVAHILEKNGKVMQVGGNLGIPVMDFTPPQKDSAVILELSSYQLETAPNLKCDVAVFLNISADHLDRHGGIDGYIAAKENIFKKSSVAILGQDDDFSVAVTERRQSSHEIKVIPISSQKRHPDGVTVLNGTLFDDINHLTFDLSNILSLPGSHNGQNAAASYAACLSYGLTGNDIIHAMRSFPGLPHRQQLVATVKGIRFINDSKATNADAAKRALACYNDIYWIIGGQPKDTGLSGLEQYTQCIRQAYIIGQASDEFAAWCTENNIPHQICGTLDIAVKNAGADAAKDDVANAVVLLSPACASWDQFDSYEHRGDVFTELAHQLQSQNQ